MDGSYKDQPPVEPLITGPVTHGVVHMKYIYALGQWYLFTRTKAFKEWWKDPETYSAMERKGHGALDG